MNLSHQKGLHSFQLVSDCLLVLGHHMKCTALTRVSRSALPDRKRPRDITEEFLKTWGSTIIAQI
jgi:hypothetical protein